MTNVLNLVERIFQIIFVSDGYYSLTWRLINFIKSQPFVFIGVVLMIIGFSVSLIKRLIHA